MLIRTPLHRAPTVVCSLVMLALPHGGQRAARRNAWASMSEDVVRSRARAEADAAIELALQRWSPAQRDGTG